MARIIFVRTIRLVFRHPVLCAVGVVVFIGVIVALSSGGGGSTNLENRPLGKNTPTDEKPGHTGGDGEVTPAPLEPPANFTPAQKKQFDRLKYHFDGGVPTQADVDRVSTDAQVPAPDPHDYDPKVKAHNIEQQLKTPAVQDLPFTGNGISADLTDQTPDGQLVITVDYTGSKKQAVRAWDAFLKKEKDPGTGYLVVYVGA